MEGRGPSGGRGSWGGARRGGGGTTGAPPRYQSSGASTDEWLGGAEEADGGRSAGGGGRGGGRAGGRGGGGGGGGRGRRGRGGRGGQGGKDLAASLSSAGASQGGEVVIPRIEEDYPPIVDIGLNLRHRQFAADLEQLVQRAVDVNVTRFVLTGTSVKESEQSAALCKRFALAYPSAFYFTAGVHPHDAKSCNDKTLKVLRELSKRPEMVAIGECGLDFDRNFSPQPVQEKWFEEQVKLACELDKPLFLHERKAHSRFIEILSQYRDQLSRGGCVHCFTGTREELEAYLEMDLHIGITGWICDERRGKELQQLVKLIPLNRLMIETDAPFLFPWNVPSSFKGGGGGRKRNEPALLPFVLQKVAECMELPVEKVAEETTATAERFFGLQGTTETT
ncbi:YchF/TatD family DNA exonuclease [Balamuthia mandrillaris]